jgi:hypothetical protein
MAVRLAFIVAATANDRADEARSALTVGLARLDELAGKLADPLRTTFLTKVPENAELRSLGARP